MSRALLYLKDIHLTFGGEALFAGADLTVPPRARIALVGRNGSGKSTLMKIAAGMIEPDAGERFQDPGARVIYLPQEPDLAGFDTIDAYLAAGYEARPGLRAQMLDAFDLDGAKAIDGLSGGEARRAAIARALASEPDILLADEPTNHLDLTIIEALEKRLGGLSSAIVLISHDRRLLEKVTTQTVWIDRGRTRHLSKGFAAFEEWRDTLLEEEEATRHKLDRKIAMEEDWLRYGVTARRKRNVRRLAALHDLRRTARAWKEAPGMVQFSAYAAERSGKRVIKAEGLEKSFGERTIVTNFSIEIARGDRIGIVGPNGAGKSTLIKLLTGALAPDAGAVEFGARVEAVIVDQNRSNIDPSARVADAITDGRGDFVTLSTGRKHVASYLKDFLFASEQWRAPVSSLSGGERGRLALAAALAKPSNLLILDEPTNDLDLETLDLLEDLLADYTGALLLVSHDRAFLDRLATSVIAPDEALNGTWTEYVGGYSDLLAARAARKAEATPIDARGKSSTRQKSDPPPVKSQTGAQKLSYKEKFALEKLPGEIAELEQEIARLEGALDDSGLFERDPAAFAQKAKRLDAAKQRLSAAEEEWLELEMKREAL